MTGRMRMDVLVLAGAVGASRLLFRSHALYDLDSVNFALAIGHFSPRAHQPHPPGYFLYVLLGRIANYVVHDANLALVLLSVLASCGVVILVYRMALDWFGEREARFSGLIFLLSPLAWFHGIVALTYSVEAFFSALAGYMCWRIERGGLGVIVPTGIVLGVSAGVRQSSLLFLGPLFLYSMRRAPWRRQAAGVAAVGLTLPLWFLPMIWISGGFRTYFGALFSLWRLVPGTGTVFNSLPGTSMARAIVVSLVCLMMFGSASAFALYGRRSGGAADKGKKMFTWVWITPALLFFTLIFFKFVNSGYLLLLVAPGCIWLGYWASEWYVGSVGGRLSKLTWMGFGAAINIAIFVASPFYCSYLSVRRFERRLDGIRAALTQVGGVDDTLVVGFDSHFLGYRHAGYYLPDYVTVEYPEVKLQEGKRLFSMYERNTSLGATLPVGSYSKFVFFPLPGGDAEYRTYLEGVERRLPSGSLQTVQAGGFEFVTGSVTNLRFLFPEMNLASGQSVNAPLHPATPSVNSREHPFKH